MDKRDAFANLVDTPKGIVDPAATAARLDLAHLKPSAALSPFVDHYWIVEYDRRGRGRERQRVLPYPCANLVFDRGRSGLFGVVTGAFDRWIEGAACVFGVRFRAGGLRPFLKESVSALTDRVVPVSTLIGLTDAEAEAIVLTQSTHAAMARTVEGLLTPKLPPPDPTVDEIARILAIAEPEHGPNSVEDLSARAGVPVRALQRLFRDYVGVSPKWVIRRYRLQEAAWRLAREGGDLAGLAQTLGYFDQAHLTRDFTRLIGCPPAAYRDSQLRVR